MKKRTDQFAALEKKIRQLEQENADLKQIIHKAPIPIFAVDKNHIITHFNQAMTELSGLAADEMIGTRDQWRAFYKSRRPVMADLIIDRSSDAQIVAHYGFKYKRSARHKDRFAATDFFKDLGENGKWLYFTASTYSDTKGNIAGAVETLQDVTEEKIAAAKTRELYRIYRKILEFVPYPIVVYDHDGLVSYVNFAFTATFGWAIDELKGKQVPFVPEDRVAETEEMLDKFRETRTLTRYETQRLTREGKILDVVIRAASHSRLKTGLTENFVILRDITDEKRLEANNRTIMRISAVLPEYPDLEELLNYISKEVKALLNAEGALVLLYDEIKDELFFIGGSYDDSDTEKRAKTFRFPKDSILAGKIISTGEYALVNDAEKLSRDHPQRDSLLGYKTRSLLEVPIQSEDRIIGVLCAINKKKNKFDYNDMELMTMIAGTVAISIENARFSDALKEAYREAASMNRAKGKAINHLSHELKTPVAILTGSLEILRRKLEAVPGTNVASTLGRLERNLNRIVDIQDEVADIMEGNTYSAQKMLIKMFEVCQDELETLILQTRIRQENDTDDFENSIRKLIDRKFGPRTLQLKRINFSEYFNQLYASVQTEFAFRNIDISIDIKDTLKVIELPEEITDKILTGLIKNAVENTPDKGKIEISISTKGAGIEFRIRDFGVGIEPEAQQRIFEGFFTTQKTLFYATKTPFSFNAGGKGADLLRMKIFSDRLGYSLNMTSRQCRFLAENNNYLCPGDIENCRYCTSRTDCLNSGYTDFTVFFAAEKNKKFLTNPNK